jgi:single-strand DNA-binding protein
MPYANKVILIGNLGTTPTLRHTSKAGVAVTNFTMATNRRYRNPDGQMVEDTNWHSIVAWRGLAETICRHLRKGATVYIEGRLQSRSYETNDGGKRYTVEVVAESVQFLDKPACETTTIDTASGPKRVRTIKHDGYGGDNLIDDDLPDDEVPF